MGALIFIIIFCGSIIVTIGYATGYNSRKKNVPTYTEVKEAKEAILSSDKYDEEWKAIVRDM